MNVTVFPLTEATSITSPSGRLGSSNQPELFSGSCEFQCEMFGSVLSSTTTRSPAASPDALATVTLLDPLTPSDVRLTALPPALLPARADDCHRIVRVQLLHQIRAARTRRRRTSRPATRTRTSTTQRAIRTLNRQTLPRNMEHAGRKLNHPVLRTTVQSSLNRRRIVTPGRRNRLIDGGPIGSLPPRSTPDSTRTYDPPAGYTCSPVVVEEEEER